MNKSVYCPKPMMYRSPDGTGRDTHAFNIHWDEHQRKMAHYRAPHLQKLKTTTNSPYRQYKPAQGKVCGDEHVPIYRGDGSGRDGYILLDNAGMIPRYKPYRYGDALRDYKVIERKARNLTKDSTDYQGWIGDAIAKRTFLKRKDSIKKLVDRVHSNSPFNTRDRNEKAGKSLTKNPSQERITFIQKRLWRQEQQKTRNCKRTTLTVLNTEQEEDDFAASPQQTINTFVSPPLNEFEVETPASPPADVMNSFVAQQANLNKFMRNSMPSDLFAASPRQNQKPGTAFKSSRTKKLLCNNTGISKGEQIIKNEERISSRHSMASFQVAQNKDFNIQPQAVERLENEDAVSVSQSIGNRRQQQLLKQNTKSDAVKITASQDIFSDVKSNISKSHFSTRNSMSIQKSAAVTQVPNKKLAPLGNLLNNLTASQPEIKKSDKVSVASGAAPLSVKNYSVKSTTASSGRHLDEVLANVIQKMPFYRKNTDAEINNTYASKKLNTTGGFYNRDTMFTKPKQEAIFLRSPH